MVTYPNSYAENLLAVANQMRAEKEARYDQRMQKVSQIEKKIGEYAVQGYNTTASATKTIGSYAIRGLSAIGRGVKTVARASKDLAVTATDVYLQSENYRQTENEFYRRLSEEALKSNGKIKQRKSPSEQREAYFAKSETKYHSAKAAYDAKVAEAKETLARNSSLRGEQSVRSFVKDYAEPQAKAYAKAKKDYKSEKPNFFKGVASRIIEAKKMSKLEAMAQKAEAAGVKDISAQKLYAMFNGSPDEVKAIYPGKKKDKPKIKMEVDEYGQIKLKLDEDAGAEDVATFFQYYSTINQMEREAEMAGERAKSQERMHIFSSLANMYRSAKAYGYNTKEAEDILQFIRDLFNASKKKAERNEEQATGTEGRPYTDGATINL